MRSGLVAVVAFGALALLGVALAGYGLYAVSALLPHWPCQEVASSVPAGYCVSHAELAFAGSLLVVGSAIFAGALVAQRRAQR
jgi:hypothetical protein